jgi:hypothetical protein
MAGDGYRTAVLFDDLFDVTEADAGAASRTANVPTPAEPFEHVRQIVAAYTNPAVAYRQHYA